MRRSNESPHSRVHYLKPHGGYRVAEWSYVLCPGSSGPELKPLKDNSVQLWSNMERKFIDFYVILYLVFM